MKFTEEELKRYAEPISETEEEKCKNAIRMVGDALKELGFIDNDSIRKAYQDSLSYELRMSNNEGYDVKIFMQGSYANNTNVRGSSDVDIAVVQEDVFRTKYRIGASDADYHFSSAKPRAWKFKDVVEDALVNKFGNDVERKNKSIRINGNNYRKNADTVPAMRFRNYSNDIKNDKNNYIGGIIITPDHGEEIINYPEVHLRNGVEKNKSTKYRFKKMVRIAKEMRYTMEELGYKYAEQTSSFGVECLLWNVPNNIFIKYYSYGFIFDEIIGYLHNNRYHIPSFKEVNNIKYIGDDDKNRELIYRGFIEELKGFYEYEI